MVANSSGAREKCQNMLGLLLQFTTFWRAKNLVTLLNRHSHCICYDALKRIDTIWAKMMESVDGNPFTVIPSNIVDRVFTEAAADNADFLISTTWMVRILSI